MDSTVTMVEFASEFTRYDVVYNGNKISEMRNNIIVNHDTLRYSYDTGNKVVLINFINNSNVIYRHAHFTYQGNQVKEISWDRILSFIFYPDGNLQSIKDRRPSLGGVPEYTNITSFGGMSQESKLTISALFMTAYTTTFSCPQGFRLQKNNPAKEILSADGVDLYTVDYKYVY